MCRDVHVEVKVATLKWLQAWVWTVVCLCVLDLRWTGDLSRVEPRLQPETAETGSSRFKCREKMDGLKPDQTTSSPPLHTVPQWAELPSSCLFITSLLCDAANLYHLTLLPGDDQRREEVSIKRPHKKSRLGFRPSWTEHLIHCPSFMPYAIFSFAIMNEQTYCLSICSVCSRHTVLKLWPRREKPKHRAWTKLSPNKQLPLSHFHIHQARRCHVTPRFWSRTERRLYSSGILQPPAR